MAAYLSRQLPIITTTIEFSLKNIGPSPIITPQIDFGDIISLKNIPELEDDDVDMTEVTDMINIPAPDKTPDYNIEVDNIEVDDIDLDSEDNDFSDVRIPKPNGEPGRPRSGGYSLEGALEKWGQDLFQVVNVRIMMLIRTDNNAYFVLQKFVKEKVDKYLDITQSFSKQDKAKVKAICNLVSQNN